MKAYIITENYVRHIIRCSTADEVVKHLLQSTIEQDVGLMQFLYETMCFHMSAYTDPTLPEHSYSGSPETLSVFSSILQKAPKGHQQVRSIDPFDALYNHSYPGMNTIFDSCVLDTIYNAMEDLAGEETTQNWFDEVVSLLEHIIIALETCFITFTDSSAEIKLLFRLNGNTITVFLQ